MTVSNEELKERYTAFVEQTGSEFSGERVAKKHEFPDLLSEETITDLEEGDIRELVRNLKAFRDWTNKDYVVGQILENGIDDVRAQLHAALYETEEVAEKFDILNENVNMLGPASITEILTFMYPEVCAIYNRQAREALQHLGYEVSRDFPTEGNT